MNEMNFEMKINKLIKICKEYLMIDIKLLWIKLMNNYKKVTFTLKYLVIYVKRDLMLNAQNAMALVQIYIKLINQSGKLKNDRRL